MPILILPHARTSGWDGEGDIPDVLPVQPDGALLADYPSDAHAVGYLVPGEAHQPRLQKAAVPHLPDGLFMHWCFLDIDNPNHAKWTSPEAARMEVEALFEEHGDENGVLAHAGAYATSAGYRLVWKLDKPIPVDRYNDWCSDLIKRVEVTVEVEVDGCSPQWWRLFRVPGASRDGKPPTCHAIDMSRVGRGPPPLRYPDHMPTPTREVPLPYTDGMALRPTPDELDKLAGGLPIDLYVAVLKGVPLAKAGKRDVTLIRTIGYIANILGTTDPNTIYRILYASVDADRSEGAPTLEKLLDRAENICTREAKRAKLLADAPTILVAGANYFIRTRTGDYAGPYTPAALCMGLEKHTDLEYSETRNNKGSPRRPCDYLADLKGGVVQDTIYYYGRTFTRYNTHTSTLEHGVCEAIDVAPEFDPQIDRWLVAFAGDMYDKLLDWLATVKRIREPTCALYFEGQPGCGKGLFCSAVSSIWGDRRTTYRDVMGAFNSALLSCPIIVADEGLPTERSGFSADFRSLIGERRRALTKKYMPSGTLIGAPRLIITANNADALRLTERLTVADIEAISHRILHIKTGEGAADALPDKDAIDGWIERGGFARHVEYLTTTRCVSTGGRFLVESVASDFHRALRLSSGLNQSVLLMLAIIMSGNTTYSGIAPHEGALAVNAKALRDNWSEVLQENPPGQRDVSNALAAISDGVRRVKLQGQRWRVSMVSSESICHVAEALNLGDTEIITRRIKGLPIPIEKGLHSAAK